MKSPAHKNGNVNGTFKCRKVITCECPRINVLCVGTSSYLNVETEPKTKWCGDGETEPTENLHLGNKSIFPSFLCVNHEHILHMTAILTHSVHSVYTNVFICDHTWTCSNLFILEALPISHPTTPSPPGPV